MLMLYIKGLQKRIRVFRMEGLECLGEMEGLERNIQNK